MARIYLAAPMRGVRLALNHVRELARLLEEMNHRVLTKHVTEEELDVDRGLTPREIFERDVQLLEEADVMIAEVSHPSLGVGFELAYFLLKGKPAAALVLEECRASLSALIEGITWPNFHLITYRSPKEAIEKLTRLGII
ncbi:MAG: nucleoside 2-deoxyribosyltransferase [Thermofilum sp.]